jgi:hypothetical protein
MAAKHGSPPWWATAVSIYRELCGLGATAEKLEPVVPGFHEATRRAPASPVGHAYADRTAIPVPCDELAGFRRAGQMSPGSRRARGLSAIHTTPTGIVRARLDGRLASRPGFSRPRTGPGL